MDRPTNLVKKKKKTTQPSRAGGLQTPESFCAGQLRPQASPPCQENIDRVGIIRALRGTSDAPPRRRRRWRRQRRLATVVRKVVQSAHVVEVTKWLLVRVVHAVRVVVLAAEQRPRARTPPRFRNRPSLKGLADVMEEACRAELDVPSREAAHRIRP